MYWNMPNILRRKVKSDKYIYIYKQKNIIQESRCKHLIKEKWQKGREEKAKRVGEWARNFPELPQLNGDLSSCSQITKDITSKNDKFIF